MTLNITIVSPRIIHQCADTRLVDWKEKRALDIDSQKVFQISRESWHASVCFAGVGRTAELDVGTWVAGVMESLDSASTFEHLLDGLLSADAWLVTVPEKRREHSFNIGAFVNYQATYVRISNYEDLAGRLSSGRVSRLKVHRVIPQRTHTFVSGPPGCIDRQTRLHLANLVSQGQGTTIVAKALVEANRTASRRTTMVSYSCLTTFLENTGGGGRTPHDVDGTMRPVDSVTPRMGADMEAKLKEFIEARYGPQPAQVAVMAYGASRPTEEFHRTQLKEKPNDPNTHSNYGAYLQNAGRDSEAAERAYLRALELDPNHVNARCNLSNLLWRKGDNDAAESGYEFALKVSPDNENTVWNYSRFLTAVRGNYARALDLVNHGLKAHPQSGRLALRGGELCLSLWQPAVALNYFAHARAQNANQAGVERGHAIALHMMWADGEEIIGAYRVAMALNPNDAYLELKLAQVLFAKGYQEEAERRLATAVQLGLQPNDLLEANFYALAHTKGDQHKIVHSIKALVEAGARTNWHFGPNIASLRSSDPAKAGFLQLIADEIWVKGLARVSTIESAHQALKR